MPDPFVFSLMERFLMVQFVITGEMIWAPFWHLLNAVAIGAHFLCVCVKEREMRMMENF